MVDITTQQTFHVEHHGIGCFQGSGRVPYRDSKLPGATDFFAWKSLSSVCREFRSWNCWVVISIIVVVIIVDISWYIMIYHDISILTIMVTQIAYHSKKFGNFCESLAEVLHVVPTWTKKTGIWYCNAAKWHWIYSGDPVTKINMPRRNNSSGQFGSTADPMKYFNSQTIFWVPDFEKVTCNDLATYWSNCPWNIQDSTFGRSHFWISCRDTKV